MRRHAKASSAGSNLGQGGNTGSVRGAFVTRGAARDADGSSAPSRRPLAPIALGICALLLVFAAQASAGEIKITFSGPGTGTIKSDPAGIECSNTPGQEKLSAADCTDEFSQFPSVLLTFIPDSPGLFNTWTGNLGGGTCDSGRANPCTLQGPEGTLLGTSLSGLGTVTIDANFIFSSPPPVASTDGTGVIGSYYANLEGRVDPKGNKVADCYFEYGKTTSYGASTPCRPKSLGAGSGDVPVSAQTDVLEFGTTYHYRLFADNGNGGSSGGDRTFTTAAGPPENCPNAAIRTEQGIGALLLPDCMAFEQASPSKKFDAGANARFFSSDGNRLYFSSGAALGNAVNLGGLGAFYVTTRTASGWGVPVQTSAPKEYCCGSDSNADATIFSPDLVHWGNSPSTEAQTEHSTTQVFREGVDGERLELSPLIKPLAGTGTNPVEVQMEGGDANLSHIFFHMRGIEGAALLPGDPVPTGSGHEDNAYEAYRDANGAPGIELLARDRSGKVWGGRCGTLIGGHFSVSLPEQGAVSADASSVFFSARPTQPETGSCAKATNKVRILRRVVTPTGPFITNPIVSECARVSPACDTTDSDDLFQAASQDGSKLFFLSTRQLAGSDLDTGTECKLGNTLGPSAGCDLYLYDYGRPVGERLTQVSAGDATAPEKGKNAEVLAVNAVSGDGSRAYFIARGVLTTTTNPVGKTAQAGKPNLYVYERDPDHPGGRTAFIGTLQSTACTFSTQPRSDCTFWTYPLSNSARQAAVPLLGTDPGDISVGGDGHLFFFQTNMPLTGEDQDGEQTDLYRYDATADTLRLITGGVPDASGSNGPFSVGVLAGSTGSFRKGPSLPQQSRWVSEDGQTLLFTTKEALAPGDANSRTDLYLWKSGRPIRVSVPAGKVVNNSASVSQSGDEIAFTTNGVLVGQDRDTAEDAYVARVDGGFPGPVESSQCQEEACQGPPKPPLSDLGATSDSSNGLGNVIEQPKSSTKKHKKHHRHHKHRKHKRASNRGGGRQ